MSQRKQIRLDIAVSIDNHLREDIHAEVDDIDPVLFDEDKFIRAVQDLVFYWMKDMAYKTGGDAWFKTIDVRPFLEEEDG